MNKPCIISAGAVTSLGFDLPASTAAMNARLDNFKETDFLSDTNENYIASIIDSQLLSASYSRNGIDKLRTLLKIAVLESLSRLGYSETQTVPFYYNSWTVIFVLSDEHKNQIKPLQTLLKTIPIFANASFLEVTIGSSGAGIALNTAKQLLEAKTVDAVLIASMDTWLEPQMINQGKRLNRLLSNNSEVGCIASEAATALIVSHDIHQANCPVAISSVGIGQEPVLFTDINKPTMGRGLRDAYRLAFSAIDIKMTDLHLRVGDVTGEPYFFEESIVAYGSVIEGVMPEDYESLFTSSYLGDIRSASGLFSVAYIWQLAQNGQFNNKFSVAHMSSPTHADRAVVIMHAESPQQIDITESTTILPNIVQQHISEASLYWLRQEETLWHPAMTSGEFNRFSKAKKANLYGLLVSGKVGFEMALKQLQQWKTVDEVFVVMYIALNSKERLSDCLNLIQPFLDEDVTLYQGAMKAILEISDITDITSLIDLWWHQGNSQQKNALFPALINNPKTFKKEYLLQALQNEFGSMRFIPIRIEALKIIGTSFPEYRRELYNAMNDDSIICRLEAACSLALLGDEQAINQFSATDLCFLNSSQRIFMIWSYIVSKESFEHWVLEAKNSNKTWELLWSIFFRSDANYIKEVIEILRNDKNYQFTRFASFVVKHLTNIDIDELDIWIQEEDIADNIDAEEQEKSLGEGSDLKIANWRHYDQYEIIQSGISYPDVSELITAIEMAELNINDKVINGQAISIKAKNIQEYSLPQVQILNLYNMIHR